SNAKNNTRSPDSSTPDDALTVHEELTRIRLELEKAKGTLIANHHAWNAKVQQLSRRNDLLAHELEESERKNKMVMDENIYLMCKHRSPNQPSSADVSQPNQRCHPLPSLNCNGDTVFDFTDPNVSISAEAFLSALDSHSARSSPYPSSSTPATPTLSVSQVSSSSLLSDVSSNVLDRSTAKKPIAPNTKRSSLISVGITRSSSENQPDMELPMGRSSNSVNRFGAKNAPETVTCTCMPNGPVLCECAVQAVRIQRQLLRCRHQLFKETNRTQDLKVTIDAYRIALENQFKRNHNLSAELAAVLQLVPSRTYSDTIFGDPNTPERQKTVQCEHTNATDAAPNAAKILRDLLLWFHQNLDNMATTVNRLNSNHSCVCGGSSRQGYSRGDKTFERGSWDTLYYTSGDTEYRKISRSGSRHIPTGSRRRIARMRDSRSLTDLHLDVDDGPTMKESLSSSPSGFPHSSSPEQIRKRIQSLKTSHALGAAAKVRSRARSVEFIRVPNSDDHSRDQSLRRQPAKETASGLSVMSELVVKLSELSQLLAKQKLIADISAGFASR
ncbi:hypothetical protein FBUS_07450, partial [Fasciolopsis buskii]